MLDHLKRAWFLDVGNKLIKILCDIVFPFVFHTELLNPISEYTLFKAENYTIHMFS